MPSVLSSFIFGVITGVLASKVSFCAKYRAGPWKIKKQTGICKGNNFPGEGRNLPFAYYFGLTSGSLQLPRWHMKTGRPPSVLQPKKATEDFLPGIRKGNLFAFKVSKSSYRDEREIKVSYLCGIAKVKTGRFIQALQSSLRCEGLEWNPYNTSIHQVKINSTGVASLEGSLQEAFRNWDCLALKHFPRNIRKMDLILFPNKDSFGIWFKFIKSCHPHSRVFPHLICTSWIFLVLSLARLPRATCKNSHGWVMSGPRFFHTLDESLAFVFPRGPRSPAPPTLPRVSITVLEIAVCGTRYHLSLLFFLHMFSNKIREKSLGIQVDLLSRY